MDYYFTLWYNTYAFSLLFYKIYMKRENAGSWNSGLEKSKSDIHILHNSKCLKTLRSIVYWAKKIQKGTHQMAISLGRAPYRQGAPPELVGPWPAPGAHLLLYGGF